MPRPLHSTVTVPTHEFVEPCTRGLLCWSLICLLMCSKIHSVHKAPGWLGVRGLGGVGLLEQHGAGAPAVSSMNTSMPQMQVEGRIMSHLTALPFPLPLHPCGALPPIPCVRARNMALCLTRFTTRYLSMVASVCVESAVYGPRRGATQPTLAGAAGRCMCCTLGSLPLCRRV